MDLLVSIVFFKKATFGSYFVLMDKLSRKWINRERSIMKKLIILLSVLSCSIFAGEPLRSEAIKLSIAEEIQDSSYKWSTTDNVGEIWVESYGMSSDWNFEITEWISNKHMVVNAYFSCGSEYDESSFWGSCTVNVLKGSDKWVPVINSESDCECEVTSY